MNFSYKYRLQPTPAQARIIEEQLNLCRHTYNTLLHHCYDERRAGRGTPTHKSLTYHLPELKAETHELEGVFSQVLQNVAKRVRRGFEGYWLGKEFRLPILYSEGVVKRHISINKLLEFFSTNAEDLRAIPSEGGHRHRQRRRPGHPGSKD